ncbi:MAG: hypothetical protein WAO00_06085 [Chthoniobacterales bacterium]
MNLKVAHLVSVQFGIFVGIVCCLAFFHFECARPRAAAKTRKPANDRAAAVESLSGPDDQAADMVDDDDAAEQVDRISDRSVPAMPNEYSPEAVEKSRAILAKLYYQQIAPRRNPSSVPANAPTYAEVAQEPVVVQANDPAPQTVAYVQPTEVIVYPQSVPFVGFAHPRRFDNRCRPAAKPGALASNLPRHPDRGGMTHLSAPPPVALGRPLGFQGVFQPQNTGMQSCPSTQGSKPRGTR